MKSSNERLVEWWTYGVLACACVLAAATLSRFLAPGHNWGDDFGAYLHLAKNIQLGRPYNYLTPDMGEMTPPGFPLLVSLWAHFTGWDLVRLKTLNVFSWITLAAVSYRLARYYVPPVRSLAVALAVLCCPFFVFASQDLISDMPYAAISTACLCLAAAASAEQSRTRRIAWLCALAVGVFVAFSFRPATIGLVAALVAHQGWLLMRQFWRDRTIDKVALAALALLFATVGLFVFLFPGPFRMHGTNAAGHAFSLGVRSADELRNFTQLFLGFMAPAWAPSAVLLLVFGGALTGIVARRDLAPIHFFAGAYLSMIILTPWDGGPRYLFPLVPAAFVFIAMLGEGIRRPKLRWMGRAAAVGVLALISLNGARQIYAAHGYSSDEINQPKAVELVDWLRTNTRPDDALCAFKPRAILYLAQRRSLHIGFEAYAGEGAAYLKAMQCDYAVVPDRRAMGGLYDGVSGKLADDPTMAKVYDNAMYSVFVPRDQVHKP